MTGNILALQDGILEEVYFRGLGYFFVLLVALHLRALYISYRVLHLFTIQIPYRTFHFFDLLLLVQSPLSDHR